MKKFYAISMTLLSLIFLSQSSIAQNTYTATVTGDWDAPGQGIWDNNGEPPATCGNCTITIPSGVTVRLNHSVILTGASNMIIGTNPASGAAKLVVSASGGTNFGSGFNIILDNTGQSGTSKIVVSGNGDLISVPSPAVANQGIYDGIFSMNNGYGKLVGNAPGAFLADGSVQFSTPAAYGNSLSGPVTLNAPGSLPVVMLQFVAELEGRVIDLQWTTAQESNSAFIAVERSTDGINWQVLGTLPAQGNSSSPVKYSYTDGNPASGANEYRLRMVDRDGKYGYSEVRVIRTGRAATVSIYPNPARDFVNVTLGEGVTNNATIRLMSQSGQLLAEKKVTGAAGTIVSLPVSAYPQGNYLVVVIGEDGSQQVNKLFISK